MPNGGEVIEPASPTVVRVTDVPDTVFSVPGPNGENLLVSLVLDVPDPDLSPIENLLTPPMLDVLAAAALAADQPYPGQPNTLPTLSTTSSDASTSTRGHLL
jgi:hypothetical protein